MRIVLESAADDYASRPAQLATQCVHAGEKRQKDSGSITTPIYTASTFTFESTDDLLRYVNGEEHREEYARYGNPNERSVEAKIAALGKVRKRRSSTAAACRPSSGC